MTARTDIEARDAADGDAITRRLAAAHAQGKREGRKEQAALIAGRCAIICNMLEDSDGDLDIIKAIRALSSAPDTAQPPSLFQSGSIRLHSGETSSWKIDCDALTDQDLTTLAAMAITHFSTIGKVEGVPRGGLRFAKALSVYSGDSGPLVIVDDVLTTGASMEAQRAGREARGVVIFARGPCPAWVTPLFATPSPKPGDALREALRQIARQPLSTEMDPNDVDDADFVGGYDTEITIARAALAKERT